jgi:hypothetical protein
MSPERAGGLLLTIIVLIIIAFLVWGCQATKSQATGIDSTVLRQVSATDEARLNISDGSLYQPAFRLLEDRGRLRLIVQDPLTHHYVLVR